MKYPISQSTSKHAKTLGLCAYSFKCEAQTLISISLFNACHPSQELNYIANANGSFTFASNEWLDLSIQEELPKNILDEKQLKVVITFIANNC
jgi:hypothetical protein